MADLAVWQRTIVDEEGNVIPGAEIEVRREEDDSLATLYADRAGETPLANPLAADMSGFVRFFAQGDAYTITAVGAGSTRTWRFDPTGRLQEFDRVSEALNTADGADTLETRKHLGTFSTVADVQSRHIPAVLESIRTFGRNSPGDGPPLNLVRGSEVPGAVQSADGQWWEDVGYNTITVRIPSQFPTLQAAIDHYSRLPMRQGATIELRIEAGQMIADPLVVRDGDYSHFSIAADESVVSVSPSFPDTHLILGFNARMPRLSCMIDADGRGRRGYAAEQASSGCIDPGCGVINAGTDGLYLNGGASVHAVGSIWTGAGNRGGWVTRASRLDAEEADFSGANEDGITVRRASIANLQNAKANDCGNNGIYASRAWVNAQSRLPGATEAKNCGNWGIAASRGATVIANDAVTDGSHIGARAERASSMDFSNGSAKGCLNVGLWAGDASVVAASGADCSNSQNNGCLVTGGHLTASNANFDDAGNYGIRIESGFASIRGATARRAAALGVLCDGGEVDARNVDARQVAGEDGSSDFFVTGGGTIRRHGGQGGGNREFNTLTAAGIIFG